MPIQLLSCYASRGDGSFAEKLHNELKILEKNSSVSGYEGLVVYIPSKYPYVIPKWTAEHFWSTSKKPNNKTFDD